MPKKSKNKLSENDIKIIIVGPSKTGKTSFTNKWTKWIFSDAYKETVVSEFAFKTVECNGKLYRIQIWDLSGANRNIGVARIFAEGAHGIIYVCDATNIETRKNLIERKSDIDGSCKFMDGGKMPSIVIENKSDLLEKEIIKDREEEIKKFAKENGFDGGFLVSSKCSTNLTNSMEFFISLIVEKKEKAKEMGFGVEKEPEDENILEIDGEEIEIEITQTKDDLISIKIDKNDEEKSRFYDSKGFYYYENSLLNITKDYEILSSIEDYYEFKDLFEKLEKNKKVKINYYLKQVVIQIGLMVKNLEGKDEEITFELKYNKNDEKLASSLIKEIIEIKKTISEMEKKIETKKKNDNKEKIEEQEKEINLK